MEFSEQELDLLKKYQVLNAGKSGFASRLALEIIPPIVFVVIGFYTGSFTWFIVLIVALVFYNVQRVIRQSKVLSLLNSISKKVVAETSEK